MWPSKNVHLLINPIGFFLNGRFGALDLVHGSPPTDDDRKWIIYHSDENIFVQKIWCRWRQKAAPKLDSFLKVQIDDSIETRPQAVFDLRFRFSIVYFVHIMEILLAIADKT